MSECVLWPGPTMADGYGRVGHHTYAHRHVWEECFGPIPQGLHLHHECGVRNCVTPEHLRLLTPAEHTRLHNPVCARYTPERAVTHCKRGHEFTEANTWRDRRGSRHCRACGRARMAARRALMFAASVDEQPAERFEPDYRDQPIARATEEGDDAA